MGGSKGKRRGSGERRGSREGSMRGPPGIHDVWKSRCVDLEAERDELKTSMLQLEAKLKGQEMKYEQMGMGVKTALDILSAIERAMYEAREVHKNITNQDIETILRPFDPPRMILESLMPPYDGPEHKETFPQRFEFMKQQVAELEEELKQAKLQIRKLENIPSFEAYLKQTLSNVKAYIPSTADHKVKLVNRLRDAVIELKELTDGRMGGSEAKQVWYNILSCLANVKGEPITFGTQTSQHDTARALTKKRVYVYCTHCGAGPYEYANGAMEHCADCGAPVDKTQTELSLWRQSASHWLRRTIDLRKRSPAELTTVAVMMKGQKRQAVPQAHAMSLSQSLLNTPKFSPKARPGAAKAKPEPLDLVGGVPCGWVRPGSAASGGPSTLQQLPSPTAFPASPETSWVPSPLMKDNPAPAVHTPITISIPF